VTDAAGPKIPRHPAPFRRKPKMHRMTLIAAALTLAIPMAAAAQESRPSDAQIAHIAYTGGLIDIAAGQQALAKSHTRAVRAFAREMVRDHRAVNGQAQVLIQKIGVTPEANPISASLQADATAKLEAFARLKGKAFDRAYVANEVAYHRAVNGAVAGSLIPAAENDELKGLLQTALKLFQEHQHHAEMLAERLG
jgi:putative membrane protein